MVYKPGRIHFVLDHLSQFGHGESTTHVKDQLLDATLFIVHIHWYAPIIKYLQNGYFENEKGITLLLSLNLIVYMKGKYIN
jgi:hypothetical protein